MDKKCAPGKTFKEGSCFTLNDLVDISTSYNKKFPKDTIVIKQNKRYLLKQLTLKMKEKYQCADQVCWINQNFIDDTKESDNLKHFTFRPSGPKKQYDWLSTSDINKVMKQYENKYNTFTFFGAVPSDFMDLPYTKAYNADYDKMKKNNKYQYGMVINLDEHDKAGSHWVGLYGNLKDNKLYFFDSFGIKPKKNIQKYIDNMTKYMGSTVDYRYNKKQHQYNNSECGVYSMNFVIRLLNGETFDEIVDNPTNDEAMNACRKVYFRN